MKPSGNGGNMPGGKNQTIHGEIAERRKEEVDKQKDANKLLLDLVKNNPITKATYKALEESTTAHVQEAIASGMPYADILNSAHQQAGIPSSIDLSIPKGNNSDESVNPEDQIRDNILKQLLEASKPKGFWGRFQENIAKTTGNVTDEDRINNLSGMQKVLNPGTAASTIAAMKESEKKENALQIADAIENGDQLADFKSLYGLAGPVKAELSRRGVNVANLQLQAVAEIKLAQTLNGPQQRRLLQSIDSVMGGLDELDNLNSEFQRTGIKVFNKGQLEALANGAGTPEQQDVAQRFKTQIIGLQDEFGNVVMGGNSPTDRALELAGKIFNSDFNNTSITSSAKQMRRLLNMRKSAITNSGPAITGRSSIDNKQSAPAGIGTENTPAAKGGYSDFRKAIGR